MTTPFRIATPADARTIAELVAIASDGVAVIEWQHEAEGHPGRTALDVGERLYARDEGDYSYRNCVVAEQHGEIMGMLLAYPMRARDGESAPAPPYDGSDVFAPYKYLETPETWYICGLALIPSFRGHGLGTRLLDVARRQAREHGYDRLSLVVFEQNRGAVRLYLRERFEVFDRAPVVPHPLIPYTGDALLMVGPILHKYL